MVSLQEIHAALEQRRRAVDRTLAPLGRRLADVTGRRALGAYFMLQCADEDGPRPQPGQFYMLAAAERWGGGEDERPFLPRAFSVARVVEDGELEFMLEDVGPGTRRLAELRAGDGLWLLGPLGKPFAPPRDGRRPRAGRRRRRDRADRDAVRRARRRRTVLPRLPRRRARPRRRADPRRRRSPPTTGRSATTGWSPT